MNRFNATIVAREESGPVVLLDTRFGKAKLSVLVLNSPDARYEPGREVDLLFHENEVVISTEVSPALSVINRIPAVVRSLSFDGVLCRVELIAESSRLCSLMTRRSAEMLRLSADMPVTVLIKPSSIIIEEIAP